MASRDGVAAREAPVSEELLREARQYRTVQTVQQWPVVTSSGAALLDGYQTLKKEGEVARVVLNAAEELGSALGRSLVLPAARSPLVRSPLRMADWVGGAGAGLLQKAVPRLTDTERPLRPGAELLLRLLLAPLTLSLALTGDLLQATVSWLVTSFPGLKPAAAGFTEKSLLGQCAALALLVWLYLPLLLLTQPVQTVRQLVSVPKRAVSATVAWVRGAVGAVVDEVSIWTGAMGELAVQAVSWAAATAQTAYYVAFVMTGLEPVLTGLLARTRSLLNAAQDGAGRLAGSVTAAAPVSGWAERVLGSELAPVRWARELWCGGDRQRAGADQPAARPDGALPAASS